MQTKSLIQLLSAFFSPLTTFMGWLVNPSATLTDTGEKRRAQLSASLSLVILIANVLGLLSTFKPGSPLNSSSLVLAGLSLFLLIAYIFSRTRLHNIGALLLTLGTSAIGYLVIFTNPNLQSTNISNSLYSTIPLALVIGSALLSIWSMSFLILANILGIALLLPTQLNIYHQAGMDAGNVFSLGVLLLVIVAYRNITERQRLKEIQTFNDELQIANKELHEVRGSLEIRVQDRTTELETISTHLAKRASELQAIALVGRAITSIQDPDELLPRVTKVISEQFGFYHIGIFLLNDAKDFAILRASNSAGGQKMLEREHKLPVGELGIVGNVAATGNPRIAANTGEDQEFFANPDLPTTQSEMALPLKTSGEIIGVLDVQSEQPAAFDTEDINLLSILADQVSIAIRNARNFQDAQKATIEAKNISNQFLRREWHSIANAVTNPGFRYSSAGLKALDKPVETPDISYAASSGENVLINNDDNKKLTVPIKLRGQVMGVVNVQIQGKRNWNQVELDITQAIADRVALAIENARLFQDAQRRASRELAISEISSKITSSIQVEAILRTAAEELSHVLRGTEVLVQLETGASRDGKE